MRSPTEISRPTVLVVDDEPMMRELLIARLGTAGYPTLQARDGQEAISLLAQSKPVAMVLDINMPGMDGFGVLESMNRTRSIETVRVMVLTARNQTADVRRAIELGAKDFLTKPFTNAALLARVERLVRPRREGPKAPPAAAAEPPSFSID